MKLLLVVVALLASAGRVHADDARRPTRWSSARNAGGPGQTDAALRRGRRPPGRARARSSSAATRADAVDVVVHPTPDVAARPARRSSPRGSPPTSPPAARRACSSTTRATRARPRSISAPTSWRSTSCASGCSRSRRRSPSSCSTPARAARSRAIKGAQPAADFSFNSRAAPRRERHRGARVVERQRAVAGERAAALVVLHAPPAGRPARRRRRRTATARSRSTRPIATRTTRPCSRPPRPRSAASTSALEVDLKGHGEVAAVVPARGDRGDRAARRRSRARPSSRTGARTPWSPRPTRRGRARCASRSRPATTTCWCATAARSRAATVDRRRRRRRSSSSAAPTEAIVVATRQGRRLGAPSRSRFELDRRRSAASARTRFTRTLRAFGYTQDGSAARRARASPALHPVAPTVGRRRSRQLVGCREWTRGDRRGQPLRFDVDHDDARRARARRASRSASRFAARIGALRASSAPASAIGRTHLTDDDGTTTTDSTYFGPARRRSAAGLHVERAARGVGFALGYEFDYAPVDRQPHRRHPRAAAATASRSALSYAY